MTTPKDREYRICANCVMDTTDYLIQFDKRGFCDHCNNYYNNILPNWHPDEKGARELAAIVEKIKKHGKGKSYDCIIGVSGGLDSSYLLYYATEELGLRPLAYSVDTGWNTSLATENTEKLINGLGLDLHVETANWDEMKDLQLAYLKSQVPYQDVQDHVIFASLYNYSVKHGIKYVLTGANYSTECVREPVEWAYVNDLTQIKDIHRRFGSVPLNTLPTCSMFKYRLYYRYLKGMKVIKPLNLIPYTKRAAIFTLQDKFGWAPYGHKHYENVFTRFYEGYWLIKKFGYDKRRPHFSSLILTGQMTREDALDMLTQDPYDEEEALDDLAYIANRLGISANELISLMKEENKTYRDYKNNAWMIKKAVELASLLGLEKRNFR